MHKPETKSVLFRGLLTFISLSFLISQAAAATGQGRPKVYACPQDDGLRYTTPTGVTFELLCGKGTTAKRIDDTRTFSQAACADLCAEHPECQSADWNIGTKNCARFSEYIPTIPMAGVNTWFPLEERNKKDPQPPATTFDEPRCPVIPPTITENTAEFANVENLCPDYNGKIYITNDGSYYKTRCFAKNQSPTTMVSTPSHSLAECMQFCSLTPGCSSVSFNTKDWGCSLFEAGPEDQVDVAGGTFSAGYRIDPPTYNVEDQVTIKCAIECPYAHGQTFEENGTQFRMSCCKRHGVAHFAVEQMASLSECIKSCAQLTSCASVDYHERSGQCYFGKHFGEPTVQAPGWASAYSIGCAGACKKKGSACCGSSLDTQTNSMQPRAA